MRLADDLRLTRAPVLPFMVMGLGWGSFAAYVPELKRGLGAGDGLFGILLLFSTLGLVSAMWMAPRLDDRLGRFALPAAAAVMGLAFVLPGIAPGPAAFALSMAVLGGASGLTDVIMNARVAELEARNRRGLMNLNHAMFSFAYAAAAALCGITRSAGLPAWSVLISVGIVGVALAPLMRGGEHVAQDGPVAEAHAPMGVVIWGGLIVLLAFLTENAMEGWSALHIERSLGGAAHEGALGPAVLGITMGIGRLGGHLAGGRWTDRPVLVTAALLSSTGLVLAGFAASPASAYLGFALAGLGVSVIAPLALGLVGRAVSGRARTVAIARASVIGFLGFFLGPSLMGGLSEAFGLSLAFVAMGALVLLILPALDRLGRSPVQAGGAG